MARPSALPPASSPRPRTRFPSGPLGFGLLVLLGGCAHGWKPIPDGMPSREPSAANPQAVEALDAMAAKAFEEGRYREAALFFREAYIRGGPDDELWNIARCHRKVGDLEGALTFLRRYLETPDLPSTDRAAGTKELDELQRLPGRVLVLTQPPGATVFVGEQKAPGKSPVLVEVPVGEAVLSADHPTHGKAQKTLRVSAGQALVLDLKLAR